jgi:hypothetical protein
MNGYFYVAFGGMIIAANSSAGTPVTANALVNNHGVVII